ncbi:tripartite tricarboxylate transporter substrate binding protein [soil metagenome]
MKSALKEIMSIAQAHGLSSGRRSALKALLAPVLAGLTAPAFAQQFPNKTIRMLVGFPPGVGPDVIARVLINFLPAHLGGTTVLVDNRGGAGGLLATKELLNSPPDGYSMMLCGAPQISIAPYAYIKPQYNVKDMTPIAAVTDVELCLAVPPGSPATFDEYLAKMRSSKPFIGTFGAGTLGHFVGEAFNDEYQLKAQMIHYKTLADAYVGLTNNDVQGVFTVPATAVAQMIPKGGKVYVTTGRVRSPQLPNVPTFLELGKPDLALSNWFGLFAPVATPDAVLDKLSTAVTEVCRSAEGTKAIENVGYRVFSLPRKEFAAFLKEDGEKWGKIVGKTGFKFDA